MGYPTFGPTLPLYVSTVCPLLAETPINALKEMSCYKVVYKQGMGLCIGWDFGKASKCVLQPTLPYPYPILSQLSPNLWLDTHPKHTSTHTSWI